MTITSMEKGLEAINDKYWNINSGGCAIFAAELCQLFNEIGVRAEIAIKSSCSNAEEITEELRQAKKFTLNECNMRGFWFTHVLVKVGDVYIDSRGVQENSKSKYYTHVTLDEMKDFAYQDGWNPAFDREQVPAIIEDLNQLVNNQI